MDVREKKFYNCKNKMKTEFIFVKIRRGKLLIVKIGGGIIVFCFVSSRLFYVTWVMDLIFNKGKLHQASASQQIFLAWLDLAWRYQKFCLAWLDLTWLGLTFCWLDIFQKTIFERYLKKTTKNGVISNCIWIRWYAVKLDMKLIMR